MHQIERRERVGYEDLMREIEQFERQLMTENAAMAMDLMVLDTKIRDRFEKLENQTWNRYSSLGKYEPYFRDEEWTSDEINAMIPQDIPYFSPEEEARYNESKKQNFQTISMAAFLAIFTSASVFGLASLLQVFLNWLA